MLKARKSKRWISVLVTLVFLFSLLPAAALAASTNTVDKVPQVSVDHEFTTGAPNLTLVEKDAVFDDTAGETFRLSLTNAEWLKDSVTDATYGWGTITNVTKVEYLTKTLVEVTIKGTAVDKEDKYTFPLYTKITGEGEAQVTVDPRDSRVSGGTYTFAVSAAGKTIVSIATVEKFAREKTIGTIQIDETRIGAMGKDAKQLIKIKLPPKFEWVTNTLAPGDVSFSGGFGAGSLVTARQKDGRTLELSFTPDPADRSARGSIFLKNLVIRADRDAPTGDVVADFDGDNITAQELVIADYQSYGIVAEVKEVKEVTAGKYNNKTAKITIKENIPGSMIVGREITVLLPEWVKINKVEKLKGTGFTYPAGKNVEDDLSYASNKNEIYFVIPSYIKNDVASKYEFELDLSVQANKSGDVVAEFFGAGMEKQELVIAEAVAPVTADVAVSDLRIGVQDQDAPDIIITETKKGMIDDGSDKAVTSIPDAATQKYYDAEGVTNTEGKTLTVTLPKDFEWANTPTVKVTTGNLEIGKPSVSGSELNIPIKSSSTKPSTIEITDVKVTLDRTVPEGPFDAKIGGDAIVKNYKKEAVLSTPVLFDKANVVSFHFADVITPAPGDIRATTTFTIGSTTYTVVEAAEAVEYTMDVAPYIKDGRTYLPVRYVGYALGVDAENILWDASSATVTILKGDRIAQMKIGSTVLLLNGAQITMDAAPEIVGGRTMLPVRWVAQALGASIEWDAATQEVTVTQ